MLRSYEDCLWKILAVWYRGDIVGSWLGVSDTETGVVWSPVTEKEVGLTSARKFRPLTTVLESDPQLMK